MLTVKGVKELLPMEPLKPLAEVYELKPDMRYIIHVPQDTLSVEAVRMLAQGLKEKGIDKALIVVGLATPVMYEIAGVSA